MYTPMQNGGYMTMANQQRPMQQQSSNGYGGMGMNPQLGQQQGQQMPKQSYGGTQQSYGQPMTMQGQYGQPTQQQQQSRWPQAMNNSNQGRMQAAQQQPLGQQMTPQQPQQQAQQMPTGPQTNSGIPQGMKTQVTQNQYNATIAGMRAQGWSDGQIKSTGWDPSGWDKTKYLDPSTGKDYV